MSEASSFVCPPCGAKLPTRAKLLKHWFDNRDCFREKDINNPLQTKYWTKTDGVPPAPGEAVLNRVRRRDCAHENKLPWRDQQQELIAMQCTYCYEIIHLED